MDYLNSFDYTVIGLYFCVLVGLGWYLKSKASKSIEDYFIGGRKLPWWALGISGVASWVDIAGTMIIVSFLFILGPRGLFIEFRGGAGLLLPFMMLWAGKWMRRSGCITGAEWMIYRFGDGFGGRFAQLAAVFGGVISTIGMLGYLVKAVGLFLSMFLPFEPFTCALILIGIATLYTMVSGFYGVVFTDMFQSVIILTAVAMIAIMAASRVIGCENFTALATQVTGQKQWISGVPHIHTYMPAGYELYKDLFMFAMFYLVNNIFRGMGFPGDPKYFGARNDRECGMLSVMWIFFMMFRWPLTIGFAVLGIFLVKDMYPDQAVIADSVALIKQYAPDVIKTEWPTLISNIMNNPGDFPAELIAGLKTSLGNGQWADKLHLLSFEGTVNPERILPAVLLFSIPRGLRGLMLVALIAASMSTFDSTVNTTVGFMTRDIYQKYIRPSAKTKELIYMSWLFAFSLVALGFGFAYSTKSVNDIWGWIVMGLGAGALIPGFLRLYWWRFNGGGFAVGTFVGIFAAIIQRVATPWLVERWEFFTILQDERWLFCIILGIGLIGTVIGTYLTKPTDRQVLEKFYHETRPFGIWGKLKRTLPDDVRRQMTKEHRNDILAVPFVMTWQVTLYLIPMLIIVQNFRAMWVTLALFITALSGMYIFWYRNLPPKA